MQHIFAVGLQAPGTTSFWLGEKSVLSTMQKVPGKNHANRAPRL